MATPAVNLPPLPPGFTLDSADGAASQQSMPPLPAGFTLDEPTAKSDTFAAEHGLPPLPGSPEHAVWQAQAAARKDPSMLERAGRYGQEYLSGINQAAKAFNQAPPTMIPGAGAAEALTTMATGSVAPALASVRGAITGKQPTNEDIASFTYQPRTESGKAILGGIGAVAKPLTDAAGATGADMALAPLAAEAQAINAIPRTGIRSSQLARVPKAPQSDVIPSARELGQASTALYQRANDAGVVIAPHSVSRAASAVRQAAVKENINPKLHPKTAAAIEHIEEIAASGQPLSLEQADQLRQVIKDASTSIEKADRRMAGIALRRYDDYLQKLGPQDTLAGNAPEAMQTLHDARSLYRRKSNAEMVEEMVRRSEINAGAKYTQAGMEHALRSEFKKLALNEKKLRMFTPEQRTAIERVAKGGPIENAMRNMGKFDPTQGGMSTTMAASVGGGVGFGLGGPVGSGVGAGVLSALGYLGRRGATRATSKNVERAREALVGRGLPSNATQPAETSANRLAQLAPEDPFVTERAAAATGARDSYDVTESPPGEEITLQTPPNRVEQLAPRLAARSAIATKTQSPRAAAQIESEMQSIMKRSQALRADSPELMELDAEFSALQEELARAKQRSRPRNRVARLAGDE